MEYPLFLEELLQEHSQLTSRQSQVDFSPVKAKLHMLQLEQPQQLQPCYIQLQAMNFLKFSRLFPAVDWLALWFLQCIYTETGNKTSVVVANNPESVMDRQFLQLVKHTQGSVERIHCHMHSLIDTDVKSASTKYSLSYVNENYSTKITAC